MGCHQSKSDKNADLVTDLELCVNTLNLHSMLFLANTPRGLVARKKNNEEEGTYLWYLDLLTHFTASLHAKNDLVKLAGKLFDKTLLDPQEYTAVILTLRVFLQEFLSDSDADFKEHFQPILTLFDNIEKARKKDAKAAPCYPPLASEFDDSYSELPSPPSG